MADSFRDQFDDAVRTAEDARDGGSIDAEIDALWAAIDAAEAAVTEATRLSSATGAGPTDS